jgi:phosphatidylserine/phosphatidylglycerophosphate/cardiolipin synthase-like enzyme
LEKDIQPGPIYRLFVLRGIPAVRNHKNFQSRLAALILFSLVFLSFASAAIAGDWRVYFSPGGKATAAIVQALGQAERSVYVQAYSFTSAPIAKALTQAHRRGVQVQTILDKSNVTDKYSAADFLLHAGIPTYIDAAHTIAHNKVMVIDERVVITGSFNFTKAAENNNAENLLVVDDPQLAAAYLENWRLHAAHSEKYQGKDRDQERGHGRGRGQGNGLFENLLKRVFE